MILGSCSTTTPIDSGIQPPAEWQSAERATRLQNNQQWWTRFGSPRLDRLIEQARTGSYDLAAAMARVRQAQATAVVADATDESATTALYTCAAELGPVELAIYNTGNNTPGRIIDMDADYYEQSWRTCAMGGFLFAREAARRMVGEDGNGSGGTLIFTGASASLRGRANFGAFNAAKGALRNMAMAMAKEHGKDGLHVGHVVVDGAVDGHKIRTRRPEAVDFLGEDGMLSIEGIVDGYVYLYNQPPRAWTFELDVRPSIEKW